MNLPNKITVSRIVLIFAMIIAMFVLAFFPDLTVKSLGKTGINIVYLVFTCVFIVAAFTDMLDGKIARKCNLVTDLGKFLDPIADKLLNDAMMIFLLVPQAYAPEQRKNPVMLTILAICVVLMIARDLIVDALRLVAVKKNIVIAANIFGKAKTVLQMIAIPMLLLNDWPFSYFDKLWPEALQISNWFFYLATIMSLVSGVIYVYQNRKVFKEFSK
jgi:CDP-diacylglycerol--glycerol-3-phosphate 3-phosphatidyltransferase